MCGNPYSRTPTIDSGDLIAIIHPSRIHVNSFEGGKLRLSNGRPGATVSSLQCSVETTSSDEIDNSDADITQRFNVRIHKLGQPLGSQDVSNPVMHSFVINACDNSTAGVRLNLGVGGDGIVGRTVSIIDSRRRLLGEGVIGWS